MDLPCRQRLPPHCQRHLHQFRQLAAAAPHQVSLHCDFNGVFQTQEGLGSVPALIKRSSMFLFSGRSPLISYPPLRADVRTAYLRHLVPCLYFVTSHTRQLPPLIATFLFSLLSEDNF